MTTAKIIVGDCRAVLATMPTESVQCIVTSPPYFLQRDYRHASQIGQEQTGDQFVAALVEVFSEARRVLRSDGTLWLNIGDTYADSARATGRSMSGRSGLLGIPWRVALALQNDGWQLRQDIIWAKPNAMPEPVTSRCVRAHEYLFLFSRSDRYYFDWQALQEEAIHSKSANKARRSAKERDCPVDGLAGSIPWTGTHRRRRSVWNIASARVGGDHHAVMPLELARDCVLAGSRIGDVVLDPFAGHGTTILAAALAQRPSIGIELNDQYAAKAFARVRDEGRMLIEPSLSHGYSHSDLGAA